MTALLAPGAHRAGGLVDDAALLRAMLRVERAWTGVLADLGAATPDQVAAVDAAARRLAERPAELLADALTGEAVEAGGNPVIPLVHALRAALTGTGAETFVHAGLTSQDVLDTGLMLLARDAVGQVAADLAATADTLLALARAHRSSVMAGRTLTRYAVPVTFGLVAAQWCAGVVDARDRLADTALPVQCGGAAGTLARAAQLVADPGRAAALLADALGLARTRLPWHTRRTPVTRLADGLVECCDALGVVAGDVLVLGRPEIGEVDEGPTTGSSIVRGGSSTMPHKRNPVLAVLVRAAALQAPPLAAQLHTCAALAVDQRPDGAWHAEWPALRRLLELALGAASQARELVAGLQVHADTMAARARDQAGALLAERGAGDGEGGDPDPASYLGAAEQMVDAVLARHDGRRHADGRPDG